MSKCEHSLRENGFAALGCAVTALAPVPMAISGRFVGMNLARIGKVRAPLSGTAIRRL